jgi:hypothetical protein
MMTWCSHTTGHIYLQLTRKRILRCLRSIYTLITAPRRTSPSCVLQMVGNSKTKLRGLHPYLVLVVEKLYPGFERACIISADMRQFAKTLEPQYGMNTTFFTAAFGVGITFGDTELKAFIEWRENVRTQSHHDMPVYQHYTMSPSFADHIISAGCQKARTRDSDTGCTSMIFTSHSCPGRAR